MANIYPVIGMSPGNSYFKEEVIKSLLKKVVDKYGKAAVLIADIPAVSTYVALGYPENRARRDKAIPQGNIFRNRTLRAMQELGFTENEVRIIDWENEVGKNQIYKDKYKKVRDLYENNVEFQKLANETTKEVLKNAEKDLEDEDSAVRTAVHYLLSEIAFMEFGPEFLQADKVIYIYHHDWPVCERYIAGEFDNLPKEKLGFEIVTT